MLRRRRVSMKAVLVAVVGLMVVGALMCAPPEETEEEPPETSGPTEYRCSFDTFPDGSPIEADTGTAIGEGPNYRSLEGDEFLECGFSVASAPITPCVVVNTDYQGTGENYLWLNWPGLGNCINASRLEIRFTEPVAQVSLAFSGASTYYRMEAYNEGSELIGSSQEQAEFEPFGGVFTTTVTSDATDIAWASFGYVGSRAIVAIKEVTYVR
jgi:hypothetical protein